MTAESTGRPRLVGWRLPLTIAGLLLVVVAIFSWAAYREVRSGALATAEQRVGSLATQLSDLLAVSVDQLLSEVRRVAADTAIVEALARPSGDAVVRARATLDTAAETYEEIRILEVRDTAGLVVVAATPSDATSATGGATGPPDVPSGDTAVVGGFRIVGQETRYAVTVPVRDGDVVLGHVLWELALDATPDAARRLEELIGAAFKVGTPGGVWTDLSTPVDAPPELPADDGPSPPRYETSDGRRLMGAHSPIPGTRWVAWVELPLVSVLERPRAFLGDLVPLGLLVVLAGAAVGGVLSRRITATLEDSEERFRTLAATAPDAIVTAGEDGLIRYFNPGAERIFGYRAGEVLGQSLTRLMPERFRDGHLRGLERWVATGERRVIGRTVELAGLRSDGSEFPLELSLAAHRVGDHHRITGIIRDVTERKRRDQDLRRYAAELEAANEELEAFSYSVSHDLRAPLRAIHGFSTAVLEDYGDRLDEQGDHYLRRVCVATERMGALIDDLLELSRATRAEMHLEPVDLSALAERTAARLAETAPERSVEFRIAPDLTALGDRKLLALVVGNLVRNAWKFTSGSDHAVIEVGRAEVGDPGDEELAFFVRDNGAGFDPTYSDKLFSPFQRLHSEREFEGTGVGLALVQRIIHRHGGSVRGESTVGEGATFHFTLPDA